MAAYAKMTRALDVARTERCRDGLRCILAARSDPDPLLRRPLLPTNNGIAAGLRNTG